MTVREPLTEQDIADLKADLRTEREALERKLESVVMPGMEQQYRDAIAAHERHIAWLERRLIEG